jgi:cysteine-rich repeat protein
MAAAASAAQAGDGCSSVCRVEHYCGDGSTDAGEQCDDGNLKNSDGCSANCTIEKVK